MLKKINDQMLNSHKQSAPASASALTVSGSCMFYGITVKTDGSNDVTLSVYDSLTAAGTKLLPESIIIKGSSNLVTIFESAGLWCDNGIYVKVTCAGVVSYQIQYDN